MPNLELVNLTLLYSCLQSDVEQMKISTGALKFGRIAESLTYSYEATVQITKAGDNFPTLSKLDHHK